MEIKLCRVPSRRIYRIPHNCQENMTKALKFKIVKYYSKYYRDILGIPNWEERAINQLQEEKEESERIKNLEHILGDFKGKKILDVGCGTGGFVIAACKKGAIVTGLEPDKEALNICRLKQKEFGLNNVEFKEGFSEELPLSNNKFDIIYSLTVLEHVKDIKKTILEIARVVKKGGMIYIKTPNYLSFYEAHYKILWLPLFPKFLAKIYLRIRNRPENFIDSINYVTPGFLKTIFEKNHFNYRFLKSKIIRQRGILNFFIYLYQKIFKVEQNIEVLIKA